MTKRVCVIYTGGTIGMQKTAQGYQPVANYLEAKLRELELVVAPDVPSFDVLEYEPLLDSSDMQPEHWQRIANDIYVHFHVYDGFVVLHGTDTMAYTSSALTFLLPNISKPVVFTGSQIPLCEDNSDAPFNVRNALVVAGSDNFSGISLLFHRQLLRGDYATKSDAQELTGFSSPNKKPLLTWKSDVLRLPLDGGKKSINEKVMLNKVNDRKIAVFTLYPGMPFELINTWLSEPWYAVILQTFGSGNAPQNKAFLNALKNANKNDVLLVNRTQCVRGKIDMDGYAGGHALADSGVISAGDRTLEATLAILYCMKEPAF